MPTGDDPTIRLTAGNFVIKFSSRLARSGQTKCPSILDELQQMESDSPNSLRGMFMKGAGECEGFVTASKPGGDKS
jgi:hypothetical protein